MNQQYQDRNSLETSTDDQELQECIDGEFYLWIGVVVFLVVFVCAIFFGLIKLARVRAVEIDNKNQTSREVVSSK